MFYGRTKSLRVGVTGLARAGKTAFLTSVAANLLAQGAGLAVLPALSSRLAGRGFRATIAPSGAHATPRFDHRVHLASLASDPARWPERTAAASLLSLDLEIPRSQVPEGLHFVCMTQYDKKFALPVVIPAEGPDEEWIPAPTETPDDVSLGAIA